MRPNRPPVASAVRGSPRARRSEATSPSGPQAAVHPSPPSTCPGWNRTPAKAEPWPKGIAAGRPGLCRQPSPTRGFLATVLSGRSPPRGAGAVRGSGQPRFPGPRPQASKRRPRRRSGQPANRHRWPRRALDHADNHHNRSRAQARSIIVRSIVRSNLKAPGLNSRRPGLPPQADPQRARERGEAGLGKATYPLSCSEPRPEEFRSIV